MKKLNFPTGTVVQLEGVYHVGIVYDQYNTVELIGVTNPETSKMFCQIIPFNLQKSGIHPVTNKAPIYKIKDYGMSLTTSELKKRIKKIRPKYQGTDYDKFKNNCQHFAYEVATGIRKSPDADPWKWAGGVLNAFSQIKDSGFSNSFFLSSQSLKSFQTDLDQLLL